MTNKQEIRKRLGHRIKVRRVEKDLNQAELAAKVGMLQTQLSDIERGVRPLYVDQLITLAEALDCPASYLLGEEARRVA
jgi:transcriptional regulator with XRE-family HTH domain